MAQNMAALTERSEWALKELRSLVAGRNFAERGGIYRGFMDQIATLNEFVQAVKARDGRRVDRATLRAGLLILQALNDAHLSGEIDELDGSGLFRVELRPLRKPPTTTTTPTTSTSTPAKPAPPTAQPLQLTGTPEELVYAIGLLGRAGQ